MVKARPLRGTWRRALAVLLAGALGGALALGRLWRSERGAAGTTGARGVPALGRAADPLRRAEREAERSCATQMDELSSGREIDLPPSDMPALRAQLFGRTKSSPVLFLSKPEPAADDPTARELARTLESSPGYSTFDRVVGKVRQNPARARAVFLREGYLYTEDPQLAGLFGALTLSLFFRDPEIAIERGSERVFARRNEEGSYVYTSGDERDKPARLLLFDRVFVAGTEPGTSRHVDLRGLQAELGFDELVVRRATSERLLVDAIYGGVKVPTLLHVEATKAQLTCEILGPERPRVLAHRGVAKRQGLAQARLLAVVKQQVDEALPFDEPKTEEGQQDGKLRPEWRQAYFEGRSSFEFNGDRYSVFDTLGRPRPPQVCIDFVLDTFERAGGSWWQPRGSKRERGGRLAFDDRALENRRSVESFLDFARSHPEAFEVYDVPPQDRVPLRDREQFFESIYRLRSELRRGDIVAIFGPRDDEKLHYHSFLIVGSDPLSGMPTELAANAGRPRIRSWEGEMQNAPKRSVLSRVRPRAPWLDGLLSSEFQGGGAGLSAEEPRVAGPDAKRPASG